MQTYLLKADADLFERIDAVAGKRGRAEFIREACEMRLAGSVDVLAQKSDPVASGAKVRDRTPADPKPIAGKSRNSGRWGAQKAVLLTALRKRPMDRRTAARELGLNEGLVERVAGLLSQDGAIRYERGMMVVV